MVWRLSLVAHRGTILSMRSIGYSLSSMFAPEGRRFIKRRVARQQRGRVVPQKADPAEDETDWPDQCPGCPWCHPRMAAEALSMDVGERKQVGVEGRHA